MYVHIHQDIECSECKAINDFENVSRSNNSLFQTGTETLIRCRRCGHEKITSTTTSTNNEPIVYNMAEVPSKQSF